MQIFKKIREHLKIFCSCLFQSHEIWRERGKRNGERGEGVKGQSRNKRAKEQERKEEGVSRPFYSESGIRGHFQVTG